VQPLVVVPLDQSSHHALGGLPLQALPHRAVEPLDQAVLLRAMGLDSLVVQAVLFEDHAELLEATPLPLSARILV
jgi:hypothetical protein